MSLFIDGQFYIALLGIKPAKNDGTIGRLNDILVNPVPVPASNDQGVVGKVCRVPMDQMVKEERVNCSECVCDRCNVR